MIFLQDHSFIMLFLSCLLKYDNSEYVVVNEVVDFRYLKNVPSDLYLSHGMNIGFYDYSLKLTNQLKINLMSNIVSIIFGPKQIE